MGRVRKAPPGPSCCGCSGAREKAGAGLRELVDASVTVPQSIEAEQNVIGMLLLWLDAYDRIDFLRPEMFFRLEHRRIFAEISKAAEQGTGIDPLLLCERLPDIDRSYVTAIATNCHSAANIVRHAEVVREKSRLRDIVTAASGAQDAAYHSEDSAKEIAAQAETSFLSILDDQTGGEVTFEQAVKRAVDERDAPKRAVSTGLANLDWMLKGGGMKPGHLVVLAGRPSMGKSALAWNVAEHISLRGHVAGFSLEMEAAEIADRAIEYHSSLIGRDQAVMRLMDCGMTIDDTPAITLAHIRLRSRRIKRKHGLALIVVDYLQLMECKADNREQEISRISRGLKAIAKELQVPVIAVAQLNRGVEGRTDKRPLMSDLRESGSLEQDADVVLMLYRDDYYNEQSSAPGVTEAIIRKQRGGKTGTTYLKFTPETTRFHDYAGSAPVYAETKLSTGRVRTVDFKSRGAGE